MRDATFPASFSSRARLHLRVASVAGRCLLGLLLFAAAGKTVAAPGDNAVLQWNTEALNATRIARYPVQIAAFHLATFHAAVHDAIVGITGTSAPWQPAPPAPAGALPEAAAAGAAHTVLRALWGPSTDLRSVDLALERALGALPAGEGRDRGLADGRAAAERVLAVRAKTGWSEPARGSFSSKEPGKWREAPPDFRPAAFPQFVEVTPFVLQSASQFRSPPPTAVDSRQHAEELAEVARVGAREGADRTDDQTLTSIFWSGGPGTVSPAGQWNLIAQTLTRQAALSLSESARLFALLNFATADAAIACWDTKYHYRTWRPETAIRELTAAVNPPHRPKPDFLPAMITPPHPDYVAGHSSYAGAAARLLARVLGTDAVPFDATAKGVPGVIRHFTKLSDASREVSMSRVFGGIHTRSASIGGEELGRNVADWVFEHALAVRPSRP